jgi:hypothetical protein
MKKQIICYIPQQPSKKYNRVYPLWSDESFWNRILNTQHPAPELGYEAPAADLNQVMLRIQAKEDIV